MDAKYCREQARACKEAALAEINQTDREHLLYMESGTDSPLSKNCRLSLRTVDPASLALAVVGMERNHQQFPAPRRAVACSFWCLA
jgi:hypothetical protein